MERTPYNRRVAFACVLFISAMFGLAYASVPFYDWFCKTTGFGGATLVAKQAPGQVADGEIAVRFDSNIAADLPWRFAAKQIEIKVRPGTVVTAFYEVENLSDKPSSGSATYNVTPPQAGGYFNKLECFCFQRQSLKPHEKREMAVRFFVDPDMLKDKNTADLDTITLSYTFYAQPGPQISEALTPQVTKWQ